MWSLGDHRGAELLKSLAGGGREYLHPLAQLSLCGFCDSKERVSVDIFDIFLLLLERRGRSVIEERVFRERPISYGRRP